MNIALQLYYFLWDICHWLGQWIHPDLKRLPKSSLFKPSSTMSQEFYFGNKNIYLTPLSVTPIVDQGVSLHTSPPHLAIVQPPALLGIPGHQLHPTTGLTPPGNASVLPTQSVFPSLSAFFPFFTNAYQICNFFINISIILKLIMCWNPQILAFLLITTFSLSSLPFSSCLSISQRGKALSYHRVLYILCSLL